MLASRIASASRRPTSGRRYSSVTAASYQAALSGWTRSMPAGRSRPASVATRLAAAAVMRDCRDRARAAQIAPPRVVLDVGSACFAYRRRSLPWLLAGSRMPDTVVTEELELLRTGQRAPGERGTGRAAVRGVAGERARAPARASSARAPRPRTAPRCCSSGTGSRRCCSSCARRSRAPQVELALAVLRPPAPARGRAASTTSCSARRPRMLPGVPIVDWRNAPISKIFYRYRQGEEYEEEIVGPRAQRRGRGAPRRSTIRDRRLQRVEAPEGIFRADAAAADGWRRSEREPPRLAGGAGRGAARARRRQATSTAASAPTAPAFTPARRQAPPRHRGPDRPRRSSS